MSDINIEITESTPINIEMVAVGPSGGGGGGGGGGTVDSVVAGNNIDVDATDPANPIVSVETLTLSDISDVTASVTEVNYVDGVTSSIQTQLDGKVDENASITGATKTKITYDAKGLVTSGTDATTADIADSSNKRYVTDAQLTVIGNTSGTNTGDQDLSGLVPYTGASSNVDLGTRSLTTDDVLTTDVQAKGSGGIIVKNNSGTAQAEFGAGGGTNATINGTTNMGTASADYHQVAGGTGTITDTATGSSTNIDINLVPKGTGRLKANSVNVVTASSTDTLTNKTIDANGTGNSISNLETADFATNVVDTSALMAAESNTRLATQKATKARSAIIQPQSGDYHSMGGLTAAATPGIAGAGQIRFHPLWLGAGTLDRIAVSTSSAAVSTWRLGLYKADPTTGLPDGQTPFLDAGTVDMNASPGVLAITISQAITEPGLYWAAVLCDAYTAQPTTHNVIYSSSSGAGILGLPQDMSSLGRYRVGRTYGSTVSTGSLPTAPTGVSMTWSGLVPRVAVRYA